MERVRTGSALRATGRSWSKDNQDGPLSEAGPLGPNGPLSDHALLRGAPLDQRLGEAAPGRRRVDRASDRWGPRTTRSARPTRTGRRARLRGRRRWQLHATAARSCVRSRRRFSRSVRARRDVRRGHGEDRHDAGHLVRRAGRDSAETRPIPIRRSRCRSSSSPMLLVPEKQLDTFDLTIRSTDGRTLATSHSSVLHRLDTSSRRRRAAG